MAKKKSYPVKPIWTVHLFEDSYIIDEVSNPGDLCLTCLLEAVIADLDNKADRDESDDISLSE